MAALQLVRTLGADIYATVGTEAEAIQLFENFGLSRIRIFWSINGSFLKEILHATGGEGVDLALNFVVSNRIYTGVNLDAPVVKKKLVVKR